MRSLATIWFRLLVVYSAAVLISLLLLPDRKPWERQDREILDEKPVLCDEVPPERAAAQLDADRDRLAALNGSELEPAFSREFLAKLAGLTENSPAELKDRFTLPTCIEYRTRLVGQL